MNTKGFQLSVNMIVVIILGLALLGVGFSIFFSTYKETVDIRDRVDSQTEQRLINLLDTGEAIAIPINSKTATPGDFVDFNLGISNEIGNVNGQERVFHVFVTFDSYVGAHTEHDVTQVLHPWDLSGYWCAEGNANQRDPVRCADSWILMPKESSEEGPRDYFSLDVNEKKTIPLRIVLPRRLYDDAQDTRLGLPVGQYIFDVDVFYKKTSSNPGSCIITDPDDCERYFSKKKIYVRVT